MRQCNNIQTILGVSMREIIRQVQISCIEKGQVLNYIWNAYLNFINDCLIRSHRDLQVIDELQLSEVAMIQTIHERQLTKVSKNQESYRQEIAQLMEDKKKLEQENAFYKNELLKEQQSTDYLKDRMFNQKADFLKLQKELF